MRRGDIAKNLSSILGEDRCIRFGDMGTDNAVHSLTGYLVHCFCDLSYQN